MYMHGHMYIRIENKKKEKKYCNLAKNVSKCLYKYNKISKIGKCYF